MTTGLNMVWRYAWRRARAGRQPVRQRPIAAASPALPPAKEAVPRQDRILLGLLAMLRPALGDRLALLKLVDDGAALLQPDRRAEAVDFTLAAVTDAALASARALQPSQRPLHMSVVIAPSLPPLWRGDVERLESLCRHLLLIGLQRCAAGLVRLRLEPAGDAAPTAGPSMGGLRIMLEDSGPPMQHGQLQRWLTDDGQALSIAAHDTSWLMAGYLFRQLAGTATVACDAQGLRLTGTIPCGPRLQPVAADEARPAAAPAQYHFSAPLVLALLAPATGQSALAALRAAGYTVFDVADAPQLLDWASVLPLHAIIVDTQVLASFPMLLRELSRLTDHGALRPVPVWAVTGELDSGHTQGWLLAGAAAVMPLPLAPDKLQRLRQQTPGAPATPNWFYCSSDPRLRGDLPSRVIAQLPLLDSDLFDRLQQLRGVLRQLAQGLTPTADPCPAFHAIRSIALSLGYARLAALMAAMETAAATGMFARRPQNWQMIGDSLCAADCIFGLTDVPAELTDDGMPPLPGFRL